MIKRIIFITILLITLLVSTIAFAQGNLLQNPSFEETSNNLPGAWTNKDPLSSGATFEVVTSNAHTGSKCLKISNSAPADTMVVQTVPVEKNVTYKVSSWIKTEGILNEAGSANLTLYYVSNGVGCKGIYTSKEYSDTGNQWTELTFFIKTRTDIDDPLTLSVRLGGQGTANQGTAYFDDVILEKIENIPAGAEVFDFNAHIPEDSSSNSSSSLDASKNTALDATSQDSSGFTGSKNLIIIVVGILILGLIIFAEYKLSILRKKKAPDSQEEDTDDDEDMSESVAEEEFHDIEESNGETNENETK